MVSWFHGVNTVSLVSLILPERIGNDMLLVVGTTVDKYIHLTEDTQLAKAMETR